MSIACMIIVFLLRFMSAHAQCDGTLAKYVDALPIPPVIQLQNGGQTTVAITQFTQKLHRDLLPTTIWGYQGVYPGPTFETFANRTVHVQWVNKLPNKPLINIPNATRTVVHLHGGHNQPESDGYPLSWWLPGQSHTDTYNNKQEATMLWYHDHTTQNTRVNVYIGMAGMYIIRDDHELSMKFPSGKYEIPVLIQDRTFDDKGQFVYPSDWPPNPSFIGDTILANGKVWPYVDVEPRIYRVRLLNGANNRVFNLSLSNSASFVQIGGDQGLLAKPVTLTSVLLSPAERADLLIDFSRFKNEKIVLENSASAPDFPGGNQPDPCKDGVVLQFQVTSTSSCESEDCVYEIPEVLRSRPDIRNNKVAVVRNLTLDSAFGGFVLDRKMFSDPCSEFPVLGTTEIWNFVSNTFMAHPIHLHLTHFTILGRQSMDRARYAATKEIVHTSDLVPPAPNEAGPKDTVRVDPQGVTSIMVQFTDYTGLFVWHCHMLEHEDYDMMRPFQVMPPS